MPWAGSSPPTSRTRSAICPAGFEYPGPDALPLVFVPVTEPKTTKNRVHLDLSTTSAEHQAAEVERLLGLGAVRLDIGQGQVPWEVLADPEGNEFCVLDPGRSTLMPGRSPRS